MPVPGDVDQGHRSHRLLSPGGVCGWVIGLVGHELGVAGSEFLQHAHVAEAVACSQGACRCWAAAGSRLSASVMACMRPGPDEQYMVLPWSDAGLTLGALAGMPASLMTRSASEGCLGPERGLSDTATVVQWHTVQCRQQAVPAFHDLHASRAALARHQDQLVLQLWQRLLQAHSIAYVDTFCLSGMIRS